jgi:energy-coupling factor transporter ATP-binding protein EcfA2
MSAIVIANYEREREVFAKLLATESVRRILLFHGESGIGKSTLLRACMELVPVSAICIPVELRGAAVSVAEIFYRLGSRIGWDHLDNFRRQLSSLGNASVAHAGRNFHAVIKNQISVSLYSHNLIDRSDRIALLTDALFVDLEMYQHLVVFAFDTFDAASTETSEWLAGPFLERVARTRTIRAVVAGQTVPNINNIEWGACCELRKLSGISDANHWHPIVDNLGKLVPDNPRLTWLSGVCYILKGNPARIMQIIERLPFRGE